MDALPDAPEVETASLDDDEMLYDRFEREYGEPDADEVVPRSRQRKKETAISDLPDGVAVADCGKRAAHDDLHTKPL